MIRRIKNVATTTIEKLLYIYLTQAHKMKQNTKLKLITNCLQESI